MKVNIIFLEYYSSIFIKSKFNFKINFINCSSGQN
jgi:hypothetical protein